MSAKDLKTRSFQLENGITFLIHYTAPVPIQGIEQFLSDALSYFHSEESENTLAGYEGHWNWRTASGKAVHGKGHLDHPGHTHGNPLPRKLWVESLSAGVAAATTLTQIKDNLAAYKAMTKEGDWLLEILTALEKRGGDMNAFGLMMDHQLKTKIP